MRSSSVKMIFGILSIVATLTLAVPAAEARPAQTRDTVAMRNELPRSIDRAARAIRRLVTRFTGGVGVNELPAPPNPKE